MSDKLTAREAVEEIRKRLIHHDDPKHGHLAGGYTVADFVNGVRCILSRVDPEPPQESVEEVARWLENEVLTAIREGMPDTFYKTMARAVLARFGKPELFKKVDEALIQAGADAYDTDATWYSEARAALREIARAWPSERIIDEDLSVKYDSRVSRAILAALGEEDAR